MKKNKTAMLTVFTFWVVVVVGIILRAVQLFTIIDLKTGFFVEKSPLRSAFTVFMLIGCAVIFINSFRFSGDDYSSNYKSTLPLYLSQLAVSVGFLVFGIVTMTSTDMVVANAAISNITLRRVLKLLTIILSFLSSLAFLLIAEKKRKKVPRISAISLIPVGWSAIRLIYQFITVTSNANVSQNLIDVLSAAFVVMFILAQARVDSNIDGRKGAKSVMRYGFLVCAVSSVSFIPRLIQIVFTQVQPDRFVENIIDFLIGIYALFFSLSLLRTEKNEKNLMSDGIFYKTESVVEAEQSVDNEKIDSIIDEISKEAKD